MRVVTPFLLSVRVLMLQAQGPVPSGSRGSPGGTRLGLQLCTCTCKRQVCMRVRCVCACLTERAVRGAVRVGRCFWPRQARDLNFEIEKLEVQINNLNIDRYFCVASVRPMTASPLSASCFRPTTRAFDRRCRGFCVQGVPAGRGCGGKTLHSQATGLPSTVLFRLPAIALCRACKGVFRC